MFSIIAALRHCEEVRRSNPELTCLDCFVPRNDYRADTKKASMTLAFLLFVKNLQLIAA
jgi:hypothetical protein